VAGGCYFFTVNLLERNRRLLVEHVDLLREAVRNVRQTRPFYIDAWVVLPDIPGYGLGDDMQGARKNVKKIYLYISLPLIIFALVNVILVMFHPNYHRCDFYNSSSTLNAGEKNIGGKIYNVQVCGMGGDDQNGTDDELELSVLDENGNLLARRHFSVNWYSSSSYHQPLKYEGNKIMYVDYSSREYTKSIAIPPTLTDWIAARIPILN